MNDTPLWYVRDPDGVGDGNDQDLLVRAQGDIDALWLWRQHYERADTDLPTYIACVPLDVLGALDWGAMLADPRTRHFKPLPD